jgi:shikimate kinase
MFIDTDANIESVEGKSMREIFGSNGEAYFRERERIVLEELLHREFQVIATGGGMLANESNLALACENGFVILLEASNGTLVKRLANAADRPLLNDADLATRLQEIEEQRRGVYQSIACKIDTESKNIEECSNAIIESYSEWLAG